MDVDKSSYGKPKYDIIAFVVVSWVATASLSALAFFYFKSNSKQSTTLWEVVLFTHMYFQLGSLVTMYLPYPIAIQDYLNWAINGCVGGLLSLTVTGIALVLYAKVVKVRFGSGRDTYTWCVVRVISLSLIIITGVLLGCLVVGLTTYIAAIGATRLLYANSVIAGIYLTFALPSMLVATMIFKCNTYGLPNVKHVSNKVEMKPKGVFSNQRKETNSSKCSVKRPGEQNVTTSRKDSSNKLSFAKSESLDSDWDAPLPPSPSMARFGEKSKSNYNPPPLLYLKPPAAKSVFKIGLGCCCVW